MTTPIPHRDPCSEPEAQDALRLTRKRILLAGRLSTLFTVMLPIFALELSAPVRLIATSAAVGMAALLTWLLGAHLCMRGAERLEPLSDDCACLTATLRAAAFTTGMAALQAFVCLGRPSLLL